MRTTFHHQQGAGAVQEGEERVRREDGAVGEHHIARRKDRTNQCWGLYEVVACLLAYTTRYLLY